MNKISHIPGLLLIACLCGCTTASQPDSTALQGTWQGPEIGGNTPGTSYMIVTGSNFEFRGADTNEWYRGTYTLRENTKPHQLVATITECSAAEYVGKTDYAIYEVNGATLRFSAFEPGNTTVPSKFDAPGTRRFVMQKK